MLNEEEMRLVDEAATMMVKATTAYANRNKCSFMEAADRVGDMLQMSATHAMSRVTLVESASA